MQLTTKKTTKKTFVVEFSKKKTHGITRILLCAGITCGSTRKSVNLYVELVSDVLEDGNSKALCCDDSCQDIMGPLAG
jgi:hypothetical protein